MNKSIFKKWWFWLIVIVVLGALGSGLNDNDSELSEVTVSSTNQAIEKPIDTITAEPTAEVTMIIDFDKCVGELKEDILITNNEFFEFVKDVNIEVDEVDKIITFSAVVADSTDKSISADFADTLIRRFGLIVQKNGGEYEGPTKDYYGELYDDYDIMIGIAQESMVDDTENWQVYQAIVKGLHQKIEGDS